MSRGLIKICGVTTVDNAKSAVELGADMVGINFFPSSPRYANPQIVPLLLEAIGDRAEAVAVTVQPTKEELISSALPLASFKTVQWHAKEHEPRPWMKRGLIPAFGIAGPEDLKRLVIYLAMCRGQNCLPRAILIDAVASGLHGGTGKTAPWDMLAGFDVGVPLILAGGLNPENVGAAIQSVRPHGVDVASGVEESPGQKSRDKMRRFIESARAAFDRN
jgi:phosphoribosylanthranilate isomerase